jgi:hypothetical protein
LDHDVVRDRGAAFDINELHKNILPILEWNVEHEVPDVIAFEDIRQFSKLFVTELVDRAERYRPANLLIFPYPKIVSGAPPATRNIAVLQFADVLLLRTAVGRVIEKTDSLISDRVFSYRLAPIRRDLPWRFKSSRESWYSFIGQTVELLKTKRYQNSCQTDVKQYFPSINIKALEDLLRRHACDSIATSQIFNTLECWHRSDGLNGLPVSLEASSALGNVFLEGLDRQLISAGARHFRYMDDLFIFGETARVRDALIEVVDANLETLGLERSISKTHRFDDPHRAIRQIRRSNLSYLGALLKHRPEFGRRALHFAFDTLFDSDWEPDLREFHYVLSALYGNKNPYGCKLLACKPAMMNLDPQASTRYLELSFGKASEAAVIDACMQKLQQPAEVSFQGLDLHLLRLMGNTRTGDAEGTEFLRIANDTSRLWPVRNFAWRAYARSSAGRGSVLMEAAREENEPNVRRAIVAGLKYAKSAGRKRRSFLRDVARRHNDSNCLVEWVRRAA